MLATADDSSKVKLFCWPAVARHAAFQAPPDGSVSPAHSTPCVSQQTRGGIERIESRSKALGALQQTRGGIERIESRSKALGALQQRLLEFKTGAAGALMCRYLLRSYAGHSSHVTAVHFTHDDAALVSAGGMDVCVLEWEHRTAAQAWLTHTCSTLNHMHTNIQTYTQIFVRVYMYMYIGVQKYTYKYININIYIYIYIIFIYIHICVYTHTQTHTPTHTPDNKVG